MNRKQAAAAKAEALKCYRIARRHARALDNRAQMRASRGDEAGAFKLDLAARDWDERAFFASDDWSHYAKVAIGK